MAPAGRHGSPGRTALGLLVAGVLGLLLWSCAPDDTTAGSGGTAATPSVQASPSHDYTATTTPSTEPSAGPSTHPGSGLQVVRVADLPPEARATLDRIDSGGPFPYDEDDGVFENREELLPDRPRGHYREYTVGGRPGDRGPLRIVAGADGERYWTDDHYRSFSWIEVGG